MFVNHLVAWRTTLIVGTVAIIVGSASIVRAVGLKDELSTAEFVTTLGIGAFFVAVGLVLLIRFFIQ